MAKKKGQPISDDAKREKRRRDVAALILEGRTLTEISSTLGISVGCAWNDITYARKLWREETIQDVATERDQELSKLEAIEREALKGWMRSQENAVAIQEKDTPDGQETTKTTKGQAGDHGFLGKIIDCHTRRCKILGLEAPTKIADTDKDGNDLTPDQHRARLIERLSRIMQPAGTGGVREGHQRNGNGHAGHNGNGRK